MGGSDRRGEPGFRAQGIAARDEGEIVRLTAQLVRKVGHEIVDPAGLADQADEGFAGNRSWGHKDRGFDAEHPFPPTGGRRHQELRVEGRVALSPAARGGVIGRRAGTQAARTTRGGRQRAEPVEPPAGCAVGHRGVAGRFGRRDAILGEQELDHLGRRLGAQFRRG